MMFRSLTTIGERLSAAAMTAIATLLLLPTTDRRRPEDGQENWRSERGDVPGWVMITMMTAIVVIALIAVFRDAVLDAVTNAFNSITGKS